MQNHSRWLLAYLHSVWLSFDGSYRSASLALPNIALRSALSRSVGSVDGIQGEGDTLKPSRLS